MSQNSIVSRKHDMGIPLRYGVCLQDENGPALRRRARVVCYRGSYKVVFLSRSQSGTSAMHMRASLLAHAPFPRSRAASHGKPNRSIVHQLRLVFAELPRLLSCGHFRRVLMTPVWLQKQVISPIPLPEGGWDDSLSCEKHSKTNVNCKYFHLQDLKGDRHGCSSSDRHVRWHLDIRPPNI